MPNTNPSNTTQNENSTQMVVPFRLKECEYQKLVSSNRICIEENPILSSVHYLPFVNKYCINRVPNESAFLSVYRLTVFDDIIDKLCSLLINSSRVCSFKIKAKPLLVLNNMVFRDITSKNVHKLGFLIIRVSWCNSGDLSNLVNTLYESKALRFHGLDKPNGQARIRDNKFKFKIAENEYHLAKKLVDFFDSSNLNP